MAQSPYHLPPPPDEGGRSSRRSPSPYTDLARNLIDLSDYNTTKPRTSLSEFDPILTYDDSSPSHNNGIEDDEEDETDEGSNPITESSSEMHIPVPPSSSLYSSLSTQLHSTANKYGTLLRVPASDSASDSPSDAPVMRRPNTLFRPTPPPPPPPPAVAPVSGPSTHPLTAFAKAAQRDSGGGSSSGSGDSANQLQGLQDPFSLDELVSLDTNRLSRCHSAAPSLYPSLSREDEASPKLQRASTRISSSLSNMAESTSPFREAISSTCSTSSGVSLGVPSYNVLDYIGNAECRELGQSIETLRVAIDNEGEEANPGLVYNAVTSQPFPLSNEMVIGFRFGAFLNERAPASPGSCIASGLPCSFHKLSVNPNETDVETLLTNIVPWKAFPPSDVLSLHDFRLRIHGRDEFLRTGVLLSQHVYLQECFRQDAVCVKLIIEHVMDLNLQRLRRKASDLDRPFVMPPRSRDLTSKELAKENVIMLLELFNTEKAKFHQKVTNGNIPSVTDCVRLSQSVKAICAPMDSLMTLDVLTGLQRLETCLGSWRGESSHIDLNAILSRLEASVFSLIRLYCSLYELPFTLMDEERRSIIAMKEQMSCRDCHQIVSLYVGGLHRMNLQKLSSYDQIKVGVILSYGGRALKVIQGISERVTEGRPIRSLSGVTGRNPDVGAPTPFVNVLWDEWLIFDNIPVAKLPLESVLHITVFGVRKASPSSMSGSPTLAYSDLRQMLGWAQLPLFEADKFYRQGVQMVPLWPGEIPLSNAGCSPLNLDPQAAVLELALPELREELFFPPLDHSDHPEIHIEDIDSLPRDDRKVLLDLLASNLASSGSLPPVQSERLWHGRCYLLSKPEALRKVLMAAPSGQPLSNDVHCQVNLWSPPAPELAVQLLGPEICDVDIRKKAVEWLRAANPDELNLLLPQLIQVLKYDIYANWSGLFMLLLEYAMRSPNFANSLYWQLKGCSRFSIYARRIQVLFAAILHCCGSAMRDVWRALEIEVDILSSAAKAVRAASSQEGRDSRLLAELTKLYDWMIEDGKDLCPLRVPFNLGLVGKELLVRECSYFSSFTCPLRIVFSAPDVDASAINIMFKAGDDLRQDGLMLQLTEVMDRLWLQDGLDLRMVVFRILPTSGKQGFIELMSESTTLRKIQDSKGVTGPFREMVIRTWLQRHNPSQLEYQVAVNNFLYSCAGCCVATYLLGVGDRHNDNIMIGKAGHMVHIDYAKILGDAQTFAGIKRDRVPFVFTPEMQCVFQDASFQENLTGSQHFVNLCCRALNILRHKADILLGLARLLLPASIPGLRTEGVNYMRRALMLDQSDFEVTSQFTRLIEKSLVSKSTTLNFFFHGLAVSKHSANDEGALLSFMPKNFSYKTDGKIQKVVISELKKQYSPERTYQFVLLVTRQGWRVPSTLYRDYSHFEELHKKLTARYPLALLPSLTEGSGATLPGRSHVREVAEKRRESLQNFINIVLDMAPEISECDTIYTFFHSTLQDERDHDRLECGRLKESDQDCRPRAGSDLSQLGIPGEIELSVKRNNNQLKVLVMHAKLRDEGGQPPDTYVKVYLHPDDLKQTKKKTRVVSKTFNPSFNEEINYNNISEDALSKYVLEVSIWEAGVLNARLGSFRLSLENLLNNSQKWYVLS